MSFFLENLPIMKPIVKKTAGAIRACILVMAGRTMAD